VSPGLQIERRRRACGSMPELRTCESERRCQRQFRDGWAHRQCRALRLHLNDDVGIRAEGVSVSSRWGWGPTPVQSACGYT